MDFVLQDRFCDLKDLQATQDNIVIPEAQLKFLSILFNFTVTALKKSCKNLKVAFDIVQNDDTDVGLSHIKCRLVQGVSQYLYYIVHSGRTPMDIMNSQALYDSC